MPTDHLTPAVAPGRMAEAVLAVLSGTDVDVAAAAVNAAPRDIADAVELYQTAGRQALHAQTAEHGWYHVNVKFPDWDTAEQANAAATEIGEHLDRLHDVVSAWWFIRKQPGWRIRLRPSTGIVSANMRAAVNTVLNDLAVSGTIERWWPAIYESETPAFGGSVGMAIAHDLFHADSRHILAYLRHPAPGVGRNEASMMLCTVLASAAGLDTFERGDLWHRIAELRPLPTAPPPGQVEAMADKLRPLVTAALGDAPDGPFTFAQSWTADFHRAGNALREAAAAGRLGRGIRHILTHMVIFHWNRLGFPAATQGILSCAASEALLPTGNRP